MDRRSFIGLAATGVSLSLFPSMVINPKNDLHSLLNLFCDKDREYSFQYDLSKPYVFGKHSYSSDRVVMARIADHQSIDWGEVKLRPDFRSIWNNYRMKQLTESFQMAPFAYSPDLAVAGGYNCPYCFSPRIEAPKDWIQRAERMWSGEEAFDQGFIDYLNSRGMHSDFEETCETILDDSCTHCKGLKVENGAYQVGTAIIDVMRAAKIAKIPGVQITVPTATPKTWWEVEPLYFRSEIGIEGLVMPMNPQHVMEGKYS